MVAADVALFAKTACKGSPVWLTLFSVFVLTACPQHDALNSSDSVISARRNLIAAFNSGNIEHFVSYMHRDITWTNGSMGVFSGRDAVYKHYKNYFRNFTGCIDNDILSVKFDGNLAYDINKFVFHQWLPSEEKESLHGPPGLGRSISGSYMSVWHCNVAEKCRLRHSIFLFDQRAHNFAVTPTTIQQIKQECAE